MPFGPLLGGGVPTFVITVTANQVGYNLRTVLDGLGFDDNSPSIIVFTQSSAAKFTPVDATGPAFDTGVLNAHHEVTLNINGKVYGQGGDGGRGGDGDSPTPPGNHTNGSPGSDAMSIRGAFVVNVGTTGDVRGGGGGGGGGRGDADIESDDESPDINNEAGGGGGGGGQGANTATGGLRGEDLGEGNEPGTPGLNGIEASRGTGGLGGSDGQATQAADGHDGGNGGVWGVNGNDATPKALDTQIPITSGQGGAAGKAIELNGNMVDVNVTGGANIQGSVS